MGQSCSQAGSRMGKRGLMCKHTENCKCLLSSVHQFVYAVTTGGKVIAFADLSLSERPMIPSILLPSQDLNLHHQLSQGKFCVTQLWGSYQVDICTVTNRVNCTVYFYRNCSGNDRNLKSRTVNLIIKQEEGIHARWYPCLSRNLGRIIMQFILMGTTFYSKANIESSL